MKHKISVIIPAYNIESYIASALESALCQNPPFYEIIIIDDGSSDKTHEIVKRYTDSRLIYHYKENAGLGPARNTGIELSNGDFIYFMDGDDVLEPGLTAAFLSTLEQFPSLDLFAFSAIDFDDQTNAKLPSSDYMQRINPGQFATGNDALLDCLNKSSFPACVFLYIFRKSVIELQGGLRFLNIIHEDELFTPDLFTRCGYTEIIEGNFYKRRIRPHSIMQSPASIQNFIGYLGASQWWLETSKKSTGKTAVIYRIKGLHLYASSIVYSARARLTLQQIINLTRKHIQINLILIVFDFIISKISRRLAQFIIHLRTKILHGS